MNSVPLLLAISEAAHGQSDVDYAELAARVELALAGPDGCWLAAGEAEWTRASADATSSGKARFVAGFDDHRWVSYSLHDVAHETVIGGATTTRVPVRQFPLVVGRDPIGPSETLRGFFAYRPVLSEYVVPPARSAIEDPVSMHWMEGSQDGFTVHWTRAIDDGRRKPAEIDRSALFHDGAAGPALVRLDAEAFAPTRHAHRGPRVGFGYEVRFAPDGRPTEARSWQWSGRSEVTFTSFERCPSDGAVPSAAPVPNAIFDDERPAPDGSNLDRLIGTVIARERDVREVTDLRFQARRSTTSGVVLLSLGAVSGLGAILETRDHPVARGVLVGQAITLGELGAVNLVAGAQLRRRLGRIAQPLADDAAAPQSD
jgi:hypothetical protein